jgi:hypothetical protein
VISKKLRKVLLLGVTISQIFSMSSAQAASTLIDGLTGNLCDVTNYPVTLNYSVAFTPGSVTTITSIQVAVSTTHVTANDTLTVNASSGSGTSIDVTSSVLATFTYSSVAGPYAGTNNYLIQTFVGSFTPVSGTTYWLAYKGSGAGYICLGTTTNTYTENWFWNANGSSYYWSWVGRGSNFQPPYHLNAKLIGGPTNSASSVALSVGTNVASYNLPVTITANLGVAGSDGRITFFANGKRIPNCISMRTSSLTASCNWRPKIHGAIQITASLTPSNSYYLSSSSQVLTALVKSRTISR